MNKRFRHGCRQCILIAQNEKSDFHLHIEPGQKPVLIAKTDNSKLNWSVRFDVPAANDVFWGDGVAALTVMGLR